MLNLKAPAEMTKDPKQSSTCHLNCGWVQAPTWDLGRLIRPWSNSENAVGAAAIAADVGGLVDGDQT